MTIQIKNFEECDDKSENFLLQKLFRNTEIQEKTYSIYEETSKSKIIEMPKILSKVLKIKDKEIYIGEEEKKEISGLLYGQFILNNEHLIKLFNEYSNNIEGFRKEKIENKGLIFSLFELIVEKIINIEDSNFEILLKSKNDINDIEIMIQKLIQESLDIIKKDTNDILNKYIGAFDKFLSKDSNFLDEKELEWFKDKYYDLISNVIHHITNKNIFVDRIDQIQQRINKGVGF